MPTTSSSCPEALGTKPAYGWFTRVIVLAVLIGAAPRLSAQTPPTAGAPAQPTPDDAPAASAGPARQALPTDDLQDTGLPASDSGPAPSRLVWSGFGDTVWQKTDEPGEANTFILGQFTLYPTATLSDELSMLAEIVFEGGSDNVIRVELERILLRYSFADGLALSAGRYHTAIGYYNTAYHHSSWLQTTIERPLIFAFEDDGGPLPIHGVGLSARGTFSGRALRLEYVAEVGNGRSSIPDTDDVQNIQDDNGNKAINVAVAVVPNSTPNLRIGGSFYRDTLTPSGEPDRDDSVFAAYVVYSNATFEFLNEAIVMRRGEGGADAATTTSPAYYSQISRGFGRWRPYARVEHMDLRAAFTSDAPAGRQTLSLVGLRFDFAELAALKAEYRHHDVSGASGINAVVANVSFTF